MVNMNYQKPMLPSLPVNHYAERFTRIDAQNDLWDDWHLRSELPITSQALLQSSDLVARAVGYKIKQTLEINE